MANNVMMLRCKWCGEYIALAKGYYGDLRGLVKEDRVNQFIEKHGACCDKCEHYIDDSTEHFELKEFYSKYWDNKNMEEEILYNLREIYTKLNSDYAKDMLQRIDERLKELGV